MMQPVRAQQGCKEACDCDTSSMRATYKLGGATRLLLLFLLSKNLRPLPGKLLDELLLERPLRGKPWVLGCLGLPAELPLVAALLPVVLLDLLDNL